MAAATTMATGQSLFDKGLKHRCDVIMIGDSNQLFGGHGFDGGYAAALAKRYGLYSTGLHFAGENDGLGAGVGYKCNTLAQGIYSDYIFGKEASDLLLDAPAATKFEPNVTLTLAENEQCDRPIGIRLEHDSPLDVGKTHIFHFKYATYNYGEGIFRPWCRFGDAPYQGQTWSVPISTNNGVNAGNIGAMVVESWDSLRPLEFVLNYNDDRNQTSGPLAFSWMRVETPSHQSGFAVHTMYGSGGKSSTGVAEDLYSQPISVIADYLKSATMLQDESGITIVRIALGLNDRHESRTSINQHFPGDSAAGYIDNITAIKNRIKEAWRILEKPTGQLYFIISLPHPISEPNDAKLKDYEIASQQLVGPNVSVSLQSKLISVTELLANNWYNSQTDHFHLKPEAYNEIAAREIDSVSHY